MKFHRLVMGALALATSLSAAARPQVLTTAQWQDDLQQMVQAILDQHPRPFHYVSREQFERMVTGLDNDLPALTDKQIIIRMAEIVATVRDGHTRLALPRHHPQLGLSIGHHQAKTVSPPGLAFEQLPLAFDEFEDGIFVVAAAASHRRYIGYRLLAIDGTPVSRALQTLERVAYAGNAQFRKLMTADRLSLPEVLTALGIARSSHRLRLDLTDPAGKRLELTVAPLPAGPVSWVTMNPARKNALYNQHPGMVFWSTYLKQSGIVYARINEITDADTSLASFVTKAVRQAETYDARLVIDLRSNFGGSGSLNRTLELAIIQSKALNRYGRTFVLIGRRTFSAAQLLANRLEYYTRVLFVGEPTGARPDHFGDARNTRLENSGLVLRVSSLHWSSERANDRRDSLAPDLPAPWTSAQYFAGNDPAMEAVRTYKPDLPTLLKAAFERNDEYQVSRYLTDLRLSPDCFDNDFSAMLLTIGRQLAASGETQKAVLAFRYGLYFYPGNTGLKTALEAVAPSH